MKYKSVNINLITTLIIIQALQKDKKGESAPGAGDKKKDDAPEDMALD